MNLRPLCEHEYIDIRHTGVVYCATCYRVWKSIQSSWTFVRCTHDTVRILKTHISCDSCPFIAVGKSEGETLFRITPLIYSHVAPWKDNALEKIATPKRIRNCRYRR